VLKLRGRIRIVQLWVEGAGWGMWPPQRMRKKRTQQNEGGEIHDAILRHVVLYRLVRIQKCMKRQFTLGVMLEG